ncbi:bola protein [Haematococcus lacustris]
MIASCQPQALSQACRPVQLAHRALAAPGTHRPNAHVQPARRGLARPETILQARRPTLLQAIPVTGPGPDPSGAPAGQISSTLMESMRAKIAAALEAQNVSIVDVYGDGRHVSIDVVSGAFEGKTAVQRQRMVYKAIWEELQEAVHAVDAMTTKTPEEVLGA